MQSITLKNNKILEITEAAAADAADILAFLNKVGGESNNLLFGPNEFTITVEQEAAYLESQKNLPTSVTLCGRIEGEVVSVASLTAPSRKRIAHTAELSVVVQKACWGQGVGLVMMEALIDYAKSTQALKLIHLSVRADNAGAIHLYHKLGFKDAGRLENYFYTDGQYTDELLMTLWL